MSDFASILDAVNSGKPVPEPAAKSAPVLKPDQLQLSLKAQKVIGPKNHRLPVETQKTIAKSDGQGNKTRFSEEASVLGARDNDKIAWETRTKIRTDLPEIKLDQQKIKPLLKAGILQDDS